MRVLHPSLRRAGPGRLCNKCPSDPRYDPHMFSVIRVLLIWLMVVAVPAQGAAAATMAFCGPNHHGGTAPALAVSAAAGERVHQGHEVGGREVDADASSRVASADDDSASVKAGKATKHKCSACASCCSQGAILTMVPGVPATDPAREVFITAAPTVDAFAADSPDRPPRSDFA